MCGGDLHAPHHILAGGAGDFKQLNEGRGALAQRTAPVVAAAVFGRIAILGFFRRFVLFLFLRLALREGGTQRGNRRRRLRRRDYAPRLGGLADDFQPSIFLKMVFHQK